GALNAKIDAVEGRLDAKIGRVDRKLDAIVLEVRSKLHDLSEELARHANRILDAVRDITGVVDEKYKDLPPRVVRLENKVFPPKRQRRR
ncbi:MAG TPA: hypothetical protein VIV40_17650, partial [Kofleriaceae bacterium]